MATPVAAGLTPRPSALDRAGLAMKVLVVSPTPIFPAYAGNRRLLHNRLVQLKEAHCSIDLVYVALEGDQPAPPASAPVDRYFSVPYTWPSQPHPVLVDVDSLTADVRLPADVVGRSYDLLIVNYIFCTSATAQVRARMVALETHDRFGNRHEILAAGGAKPSWISATVLAEAEATARADIVCILRDDDRPYYESLSNSAVVLLRHAEPQRRPWPAPGTLAAGPKRFGFVGSSNAVNQKALLGLLAAMRRAGARLAGLRVHVLGGICGDVAPEWADLCVLEGVVADEADLYSRFDVLVNPVFAGTGIKIKTVEALAYAKPVLSGREATAGFPWVPPCMALPDADAVVDMMIRLHSGSEDFDRLTADSSECFRAYSDAAAADLQHFLGAVSAGKVRRKGGVQIRWDDRDPLVAIATGLPRVSPWDLLRQRSDDIANIVSVEQLARAPLYGPAYLPAAVAAELCDDTRRSQRLLMVHFASGGAVPPVPQPLLDMLADRVERRPVVRSGTEPGASMPYRQILAGALRIASRGGVAKPLEDALHTLIRAPGSGQAVLPDRASVAMEAAPSVERLPDALDLMPMRASSSDAGAAASAWPTAFVDPAARMSSVTVQLSVTGVGTNAEYERVDATVLGLATSAAGHNPYVFIKFLCFRGAWLIEVHPHDSSAGSFISDNDAWDEGEWGPYLKLPIHNDLPDMLASRLMLADVRLLVQCIMAVRNQLAQAAPAPDAAQGRLLAALQQVPD